MVGMPTVPTPYEPNPHYPTVGGSVTTGWDMPIAELSSMVGDGPTTLAIDGPAAVDWDHLVEEIGRATPGLAVTWFDVRRCLVPWPELVRRTASVALADDPDFDHLATGDLTQLFDQLPAPPRARCRPHHRLRSGRRTGPARRAVVRRSAETLCRGSDLSGRWRQPRQICGGRSGDHQAAVLHRLAAARSASRRDLAACRSLVRSAAAVDAGVHRSVDAAADRGGARRADLSGLGPRSTPRPGAATGGSASWT